MNIKHLSASSLGVWNTCQLQFYADRILKIPRGETHPLALMGSAVHYAFDRGHDERNAMPYLDQACDDLNLNDITLRDKAKELCEVCEQWGWWDGVDDLDVCVPEKEFLIDIGEGVKLKGFMDRIDIKGSSARILDIKTQSKKISDEKLRNNVQADIYNIAARKIYPQVKGLLRFEFWTLRHEIQSITKTEECAKEEEENLRKQGVHILEWPQEEHPPATMGNHCRWCNFIDSCPEW